MEHLDKRVNRKELANLLNISINAIKQLEKRKTLERRAVKEGYKILDRVKIGNKVIYLIKIDNKIKAEKEIRKIYKTNKANEFADYFHTRTKKEAITTKDIAATSKVTKKTVIKWDNTLEDKQILSKDGYYYFTIDRLTDEVKEVTKEEYKNYWRNKAYLKAFEDLRLRYKRGEINLMELQLASGDIAVIISLIENKYYFKIKKYKVNRNEMYIHTRKLIQDIKGVTIED